MSLSCVTSRKSNWLAEVTMGFFGFERSHTSRFNETDLDAILDDIIDAINNGEIEFNATKSRALSGKLYF